MGYYDDDLLRAIQHKLMPDVAARWDSATVISFTQPVDRVVLPLQADVSVAYDKKLAAFSVRGKCVSDSKETWLMGEGFFSSKELLYHRERAFLIEHLFENVKRSMISALTDAELKRLLAS